MSGESVALFISLYVDEDSAYRRLPTLLRAEGFDAVSALELGHTGSEWDDEKHLTYAAENQRAVLTHNTRHFVPFAQKWEHEARDHYGIIVSEQVGIGEVLRRLLRLLDTMTKDEIKNKVRFLSDFADRA
jgi:hypothetical protein